MPEGQPRDGSAYAGRPSMCRQCGALVGAGESHCAMCGAPSTAGVPHESDETRRGRAPRLDHETVRFVRAIITRPATFTFVFLMVNVFLYFLMSFSGGANGEVLIAYGAKLNHLINHEGQWWRFVTPIFLHVQMPGIGPLHLLTNMYGLFMLGPYVEKLYGSAKFVVFWIATGVAGVAASYLTVQPALANSSSLGRFLFKSADAPSAGASGALFGLVGVLFIFGIKYRKELPAGFKRAFGTGMLPMISINLFIGYVGRGFIDNAAHLGGLVAGMALALSVGYKRLGERGPVAYAWHFLQAASLVLVAVCFTLVVLNYDKTAARLDNIPAQSLAGGTRNVAAYVESLNAAQRALVGASEGNAGALGPAIEGLEKTPSLGERADSLREELKALLIRTRDLEADRSLSRRERRQRAEKLSEDYAAWVVRRDEWINGEGKDLGLVLRDPETPGPEAEK